MLYLPKVHADSARAHNESDLFLVYLPVSMIRNSMLSLPKDHADSARIKLKANLSLVYLPVYIYDT